MAMALTCARRDCADYNKDLTHPDRHNVDPGTGLETCLSCGAYLAERPVVWALREGRPGPDPSPEPWEGSWTRDGEAWAIRLWMPDNDHRDDEPEEGHKVRITTRSGKVQVVRLGRLLDVTRRSITFAAPERK